MDICFRWNRKNTYSIAALVPLIPEGRRVKQPCDGIMIYSFATRQAEAVFREVENAGTDSVFIAGGPHPSGATEQTLEYFDYVVLGEGEETLPELIATVASGKDVSGVNGIAYKDSRGNVVHTDVRDPVDLNMYPCFDPDIVMAPLEISRGCPFRCKYCQTPRLFGNTMRHRSIDSIKRFSKYYKDIRFTSSNALAYGSDGIHPRYDKVEKLLRELYECGDRNIFFGTFPSEVRPEFVSTEGLELITKYCSNDKLSLGAQSGSERILKEIHRGHTVDDITNGIEVCFEHGITPVVDFMVGFPGETAHDQDMSLGLIKWICKKGGHIHSHYMTPLPGTPYENCIPSPVSDRYRRTMGKMALRGKVTGCWE